MRIKYSDWEIHIDSISKELNGQQKIVKRPSMGARFEYLNSECFIEYKNGIISIEQLFIKVDYENGAPEKLNIIYEFENRFDFFLSINQRDFFDRIFGWNRIKIGDSEFDEKYTIQSNDKLIAKKVFEKLEFRRLLIDNNSIVLNISTSNRKTRIVIKNMLQKVYTLEEYQGLISFIKHLIDNIKR